MLTPIINFAKKRFVGFSIVGVLVMIAGFGLLALLVEVLHVNKYLATIMTTIFSLETNFLLNKYLNWRDREGGFWPQWARFHIARAGTVTFNQLLIAFLMSHAVHYMIATGIGTAIGIAVNYFGNEKFVFQTRTPKL